MSKRAKSPVNLSFPPLVAGGKARDEESYSVTWITPSADPALIRGLYANALVRGMLSEHDPPRERAVSWLDAEGWGQSQAALRACRQGQVPSTEGPYLWSVTPWRYDFSLAPVEQISSGVRLEMDATRPAC